MNAAMDSTATKHTSLRSVLRVLTVQDITDYPALVTVLGAS